jgi:hypothetical protein
MKRIFVVAALAVSALLVMASAASAVTTVDPTQAPSGTHVANSSPAPACSVSSTGSVTCGPFTLGGVGNTNATEVLTANYTATINCTNRGGSLVESHNQDATSTSGPVNLPATRNGQIVVFPITVNPPTNQQILQQADCPNPNWTPSVQGGSVTFAGFTYTLTFAGFTSPYLTITG